LATGALHDEYLLLRDEATMSQQEHVNVIAAGDAAINAENFDPLMTFYADDATLVIEPGRCVTGHVALRNAFVAIAEHRCWGRSRRRTGVRFRVRPRRRIGNSQSHDRR
jgi:hypothetical protein